MMLDDQEAFNERRQLGDDQDLQLAIDHDLQFEQKDLRAKVLFAMQGLGSIKTIKKDGRKIEAYIKGDYCQQSIKDLVKHIRKDIPQNPKVNIILSQFNIVESDLIKILVLHAEDKKLSFWLLALLSYLTVKPSSSLTQVQKNILFAALQEYKKSFMKNQGITYLILHISDYVKTEKQKRQKAHIQMMEFIITLIRNLLQIRNWDPESGQQSIEIDQLHSHFLVAMLKEDMMGPLFYLVQTEKGQLMERVYIPLLEIFYHIFTCFNPVVLYSLKKPLNLREQALKQANKRHEQVRHSRFMPNFTQTNQNGVKRVVHTLDKKQQVLAGQRRVPSRRAELKKVKKIERDYIQQNFLQMHLDNNNNQETPQKKLTVKDAIFESAKQFCEIQFEMLSRMAFDSIYKEVPRINKQNVIQYLLLCSWQIRMTRAKYYKAKSLAKNAQQQGMVEFDLGQILFIMQTGHFQLIYKLLFREATRQKKKQFDINMFHAAIILFLNYIEVIQDISKSFNTADRKNANALMANMFRHDIARIFKIGFHQISHQKILETLILVNHKFFHLLSEYSKGKVLSITTNKLLKQKKSKKKLHGGQQQQQQQMKGFISEDSDAQNNGNLSDSYHEDDDGQPRQRSKKQKVKQTPKQKAKKAQQQRLEQQMQAMRFQERKFNQMTEFAVVADYQIIGKYLIFLRHQKHLDNPKQVNTAIFFYFQRICKLLKGQWLFFQAQTLTIFNKLLNNPQFCRQYKSARENIKHICTQFIKLMRTNRLALIQSLFRYSNIGVKQQIFKNYDQISQAQQQDRYHKKQQNNQSHRQQSQVDVMVDEKEDNLAFD